MKKSTFRKLVNSQLSELAREYLINMKHNYSKLNKICDNYSLESYLSSKNISNEEKQTLFKFRTRMVAVKSNFKCQCGANLACQFCPEEDTQSHLLSCKELTKGLEISHVVYEDISKQEKAAKTLNRILKQRYLKLKMLPTNLNLFQ